MEAVNATANAIIREFVNPAIYVLSAFAFVWFLYGVFIFILNKSRGDTEAVNKGKRHMIWGVIGLIIIFSAASIYNFITSFFN